MRDGDGYIRNRNVYTYLSTRFNTEGKENLPKN